MPGRLHASTSPPNTAFASDREIAREGPYDSGASPTGHEFRIDDRGRSCERCRWGHRRWPRHRVYGGGDVRCDRRVGRPQDQQGTIAADRCRIPAASHSHGPAIEGCADVATEKCRLSDAVRVIVRKRVLALRGNSRQIRCSRALQASMRSGLRELSPSAVSIPRRW